ncbi:MAG TPA: BMP family ABC transporter substrate-binding protein, partial [Gaiellaceae bacterium]|nr:BMP family ABC transporter substrate-binding protein [Gaiellaceae bacterium]
PETRRVVAAFKEGLSRARPGGRVLVSYAGETVDPTACERVANRQIDAGSDVVFVHAGMCGTGALAVSRARGVWAIASDGLGRARDNVIGASFTDWDNAVYAAIQAFRDGRLPPGRDATLGLDGYHVGLEMHTAVPARVASKVVELCSDLRVRSESDLADASGT